MHNLPAVQGLIVDGADPLVSDRSKRTSLDLAAELDHMDIVLFFLKGTLREVDLAATPTLHAGSSMILVERWVVSEENLRALRRSGERAKTGQLVLVPRPTWVALQTSWNRSETKSRLPTRPCSG